ncbi:MAG: large conductance mechanosensitive channel protein MscL [Thermoplasmatota archaeon]
MATATIEEPILQSPNLFQEFRAFLDKYGVVGLAIAFIIGAALTALVQALVKDLLMPTIQPILAVFGSDWRTSEVHAGPFGPYLIGDFIYNVIYFVIIAAFVFFVAKYALRMKTVEKI